MTFASESHSMRAAGARLRKLSDDTQAKQPVGSEAGRARDVGRSDTGGTAVGPVRSIMIRKIMIVTLNHILPGRVPRAEAVARPKVTGGF